MLRIVISIQMTKNSISDNIKSKLVRFVNRNRTIYIDNSFDCDILIVEYEKEDFTMSITATELKLNLSKYLLLSATEDIYITKNGKVISKLTNPFQERVDIAKSLFGVLPADISLEEARDERLDQI